MAIYNSPGVYISENDFSEYITSSSTCSIGIVGEARRGPVGTPVLVTSQNDLLNTFGNPVEGCYGIYSALQVLTKASEVYYVRAVRSATKATAGKKLVDAILYEAVEAGIEGNNIEVTQGPEDPTDNTFTLTFTNGVDTETFTGLTFNTSDTANYLVNKINGVSELVTVEDNLEPTTRPYTPTTTPIKLSGAEGTASKCTAGIDGTDPILFTTTNPDSTLNNGYIHITEPEANGYFSVIVSDADQVEVETWEAVTMDKNDERYIQYVINTNSKRILVTKVDESIVLAEDTLRFTSNADDGSANIADKDIIGEYNGTGIMAFSNTELISIDVLIVPGRTNPEVIYKALDMCESRGDTIFVADVPFGLTAQQVVEWSNGAHGDHAAFNSCYGAFYWPWIQISDVYSKDNLWLPPSGFVAAQYAYNDIKSFPWYAPAGLNRGLISNAIALEHSPTKGERDLVYGNRNIINPIANVLGQGLVIWGQKTMQRKPTALDRVNVRRCLNYLERTVGAALKYYVFEQNTPATWDRAKTLINPILANAKANNGIYEYRVIIKPTPEDIENNRMPVLVYIKPTKTSEYIPLTFNVMPYGASFVNIV